MQDTDKIVMKQIAVSGYFDDLRSRDVRFLEEASHLGDLNVLLWRDEASHPSKFPQAERLYFLESLRYVSRVWLVDRPQGSMLPQAPGFQPDGWAAQEAEGADADAAARQNFCIAHNMEYHGIKDTRLNGFPIPEGVEIPSGRAKVIVTGCYDWLHSGHVRFFEEVSGLGDLYVAVGNDANVRFLKGEGHPLQTQNERRYMVQAIRFVKQVLVTSGWGWMDVEPEIELLKPDIYAVNEDGDKPEKREFCAQHHLEYVVLKRLPKEGLPRRQSTDLRGF
jgi:cytidyltransferase-like protein